MFIFVFTRQLKLGYSLHDVKLQTLDKLIIYSVYATYNSLISDPLPPIPYPPKFPFLQQ